MKRILSLAAATVAASSLAAQEYAASLPQLPTPAVDAVIQWVKPDDTGWRDAAPTFEISDPAESLSAKGWIASTESELLVRVDVIDPVHINEQTGGNIWNGDFLRIAIDGKGDGTRGGARDVSGLLGEDDASIGFALTPTGPQGHTYASMLHSGEYPPELLAFTRDDAANLTRYDIRLPWSRLGVTPGALPSFGIVVQVRSIDSADQREPAHVRWGDGANEPKPGLFKQVALAEPPHQLIAFAVLNSEIWERGDQARMVIATNRAIELHGAFGEADPDFSAGEDVGEDGKLNRFLFAYRPRPEIAGMDVLNMSARHEGEIVARAQLRIDNAPQTYSELVTRLESLIATARHDAHPLFQRHLRSVKAMVESEWSRATLYCRDNPALARETLGYLRALKAGFDGRSAEWNAYVDDGLPLFMAYLSPRDKTLQWYTLTLPKDWSASAGRDEQPAYPMFFELHGAGNPHYLNNVAGQLGADAKAPDLLGYDRPRTYAMIERSGYHVFPFGRGNSGYRDIGETDVWETYHDAQATVKIDPDRRYLYGFSMGGSGTWNLGSRTPDRWAAMAILGMGARVGDWGQAHNVANTPVFIWGGETDTIAFRGPGTPKQMIERFAQTIRDAGGTVDGSTTPDLGHNYLGEVQERSIRWLQQHTRRRPANFTFVADTDQHRGVWGITMTRDLQVSALPRFTCAIDGQIVTLTADGTPLLNVDLGPDGLQMSGEVRVLLNGAEVYSGPADTRPLRLPVR